MSHGRWITSHQLIRITCSVCEDDEHVEQCSECGAFFCSRHGERRCPKREQEAGIFHYYGPCTDCGADIKGGFGPLSSLCLPCQAKRHLHVGIEEREP